YRQELNLRQGMLLRSLQFEDTAGRRTRLEERRLVSMRDKHLAALELTLMPENWSGDITLPSGIDGRNVNTGARPYRKFNNEHLEPLAAQPEGDIVTLLVRTSQSDLRVAEAARSRFYLDGDPVEPARRTVREPGYIAHQVTVRVERECRLTLEKLVA